MDRSGDVRYMTLALRNDTQSWRDDPKAIWRDQYDATNTAQPIWRDKYVEDYLVGHVYHPARDSKYHIVRLEGGCHDLPNNSHRSETLVYAKVSRRSYRTMDFGTS